MILFLFSLLLIFSFLVRAVSAFCIQLSRQAAATRGALGRIRKKHVTTSETVSSNEKSVCFRRCPRGRSAEAAAAAARDGRAARRAGLAAPRGRAPEAERPASSQEKKKQLRHP